MIFNHPTTFILSNLHPQFTSQTSTSYSSPPLQPVGGSEGAIWSPSRKSLQLSPQDHARSRSSLSDYLLSSHPHAIVTPVMDRNQDPLPPAPAPAQPDRNSFSRNNNNNNHRHRSSWQGDGYASFPPGLEDVDGDGERNHIGQRSNRRQNRTSYQLVMEQLAMLDTMMESEAEGVASGSDSGRLRRAVFLYGTSAVTAGGAGAGIVVDGPGAVREEEEEERPELGLQIEEPPVPMPSVAASRRRTWN